MSDPQEAILVENIDTFVQMLIGWHQDKVRVLEHMLAVPEGTAVSFNGEDDISLSGDVYKGFQIGLSLGLMELGRLPFAIEMTDDEAPDDAVKH